jgi:addiction module RelE/StbE family toxin
MKKNKEKISIDFTSLFNKQREASPLEIKIAFREVLEIFLEDSDNEILRNHYLETLGKKYFGTWSIDITSDWRALYRKEGNLIIFIELGTHEELYS